MWYTGVLWWSLGHWGLMMVTGTLGSYGGHWYTGVIWWSDDDKAHKKGQPCTCRSSFAMKGRPCTSGGFLTVVTAEVTLGSYGDHWYTGVLRWSLVHWGLMVVVDSSSRHYGTPIVTSPLMASTTKRSPQRLHARTRPSLCSTRNFGSSLKRI